PPRRCTVVVTRRNSGDTASSCCSRSTPSISTCSSLSERAKLSAGHVSLGPAVLGQLRPVLAVDRSRPEVAGRRVDDLLSVRRDGRVLRAAPDRRIVRIRRLLEQPLLAVAVRIDLPDP